MAGLKVLTLVIIFFSFESFASQKNGKYFDRAIIVMFENANYSDAIKQPFFKKIADQGAHFSNFLALTHPSQGNYIALTSGSLNGVNSDGVFDIDVRSIADLLEEKGLTWKVYSEAFPGHCFLGKSKGNYVRKHVPFISYLDIQKNPQRCAKIVEAAQFDVDVEQGKLPDYIFYVPDVRNDGHDTGVSYADKWYNQKFSPYLNNAKFMENTVLITAFDESSFSASKNQIYVSIVGPGVKSSVVADSLNLYSLLNLFEENWNLGSLGKNDIQAVPVPQIWK